MAEAMSGATRQRSRGCRGLGARSLVLATLLSSAPATMAACISLQGSTACPAFQSASVSNDDFIVGIFSFMRFVSNRQNFDERLKEYIRTSYVQEKYQTLLGCGGIDLSNTTEQYARFSTTVVCNALVQNSIDRCSLSSENSKPVCAETCAQFAQSEALIASDNRLCSNAGSNAQKQIRADFTNCALPANSLSTQSCIQGITNEPENCGYAGSTIGLCSYCASGGINSTDTCCYTSNAEQRCANVVLPTVIPTMSLPTVSPTSTATSTPAPSGSTGNGLSGGAIAGIVIGSVIGFALLAALVFVCILLRRRRRGSQKGSIFNQPSPARQAGAPVSQMQNVPSGSGNGYEVLPGGRIARMSALEGHSGDSPSRHGYSSHGSSGLPLGAAALGGAAAGYAAGRSRGDNHSSSDDYAESPEPEPRIGVLRPPPAALRRNGSLSSGSVLGEGDPHSPGSAGGMSSPPGMASQQSEQLPFFKDYYSQDDIHPGDTVAVLWAYQPRAADEFSLDRGDMLKVVGIWDDGWATGVLLDDRADEWEARRQKQRDSGVSHTSGRPRDPSPAATGEIKAFPLVCVCLPEHWRKTIDSDGSTEAGSSAQPA